MKKFLSKFYLTLIFILLYAPIATLIVLSFNASKTRAKWGGFTLKWYFELFQNDAILEALSNTLIIAFLSALIATVIGTAASIGINAMNRHLKTIFMSVTNIPMLNADIVTGISLMLLFIAFGVRFGFSTILLAHITFNIPYVILSVMPKLKQIDQNTYMAALDLGASPFYAFTKLSYLIYYQVFYQAFYYPLLCHWMILSLLISQKILASIHFLRKFMLKFEKELNQKCMPCQHYYLYLFYFY